MIKISIGEFLSEKLDEFNNVWEHDIYVFRDGDAALYLGKSNSMEARIWEHIGPLPGYPYYGRFDNGPSNIGKLIIARLPDSLSWTIELLNLEDCRSCAPEISAEKYKVHSTRYIPYMEMIMIEKLRPVLNVQHASGDGEAGRKYRLPIPGALIKAHSEIFD